MTPKLQFILPDTELNRQVKKSIGTTLRQRAKFGKYTIFLHGYPNYPYSTLHQSYPMHLVALASGLQEDVADEIRAYASLQSDTGAMDYRIGPEGPVPYFSYYTEAMFVLCLDQYVNWTGDMEFLTEKIYHNRGFDHLFFWHTRYRGYSGTILAHAIRAADFTLSHLYRGCVPPMDWHDALPASSKAFTHYYQHPPRVEMRAAAEGTFVWCDALEKLSKICRMAGESHLAVKYQRAARRMAKISHEVFYNPETGLYGELLDGTGKRYFDQISDFWSYPQIRAVTVGLKTGKTAIALLDKVYRYRKGKFGIRICNQPHFAVTENMLRVWPEKTHLLVLEYIKHGKPDVGLRMIRDMLPKRLHVIHPTAPSEYYAESYESNTAIPHGITYGGDPELIHACLEGFGGVSMRAGKISVTPQIPDSWRGKKVAVSFEVLEKKFELEFNER